jgi:hypothetical protein
MDSLQKRTETAIHCPSIRQPKTPSSAENPPTQPPQTNKDKEGQEEESSSPSMSISFDQNFSLSVRRMAGLIQSKTRKPITKADWIACVQASHVVQSCIGQLMLGKLIDDASRKTELVAGYFTKAAIGIAEADGEDFDQMKKAAPQIPFDPPPRLQVHSSNTGLEFERARSAVVREARARGDDIDDATANRLANDRIAKAGAG